LSLEVSWQKVLLSCSPNETILLILEPYFDVSKMLSSIFLALLHYHISVNKETIITINASPAVTEGSYYEASPLPGKYTRLSERFTLWFSWGE
jgi:hypothetical protein